MLDDDDFAGDLDDKTLLQRFGLPIGAGILIVVVGISAFVLLRGRHGPSARPHNEPHITQVQLPPPPPPPPPPKTPPPPKKPEVMPKLREPTPQKAVSKPAPKAPAPPAAVTTSIQGNGPSSLAAGNDGGGGCLGAGCGTGDGSGGDNDAYYGQLISQQIKAALGNDDLLRFAKYSAKITFTLDASGHLVGTQVASFIGDADDRAAVERVLRAVTTGDSPAASVLGRQFTIQITERARG